METFGVGQRTKAQTPIYMGAPANKPRKMVTNEIVFIMSSERFYNNIMSVMAYKYHVI